MGANELAEGAKRASAMEVCCGALETSGDSALKNGVGVCWELDIGTATTAPLRVFLTRWQWEKREQECLHAIHPSRGCILNSSPSTGLATTAGWALLLNCLLHILCWPHTSHRSQVTHITSLCQVLLVLFLVFCPGSHYVALAHFTHQGGLELLDGAC